MPCSRARRIANCVAYVLTGTPSPLSPFTNAEAARLAFHVNVGISIDDAVANALRQRGEARYAVTLNTAQIAEHEVPRRLLRRLWRDAFMHEHVPGKLLKARRGNTLRGGW